MGDPPPHVCSAVLRLPRTYAVFRCGDGSRVTGAQVQQSVAALAHLLRTRLAVRPGEVVALAAGAAPEFLYAWLAVTAVGAVAALLNTKWCVHCLPSFAHHLVRCVKRCAADLTATANRSVAEAVSAARRVGAVVLLADCAGLDVARGAARSSPGFIRSICMLDGTAGVDGALDARHLEEGASTLPLPLLHSGLRDDICTLVFTSASTATPKAVALTHANIGAATAGKAAAVGYSAHDVYLHAAPLCHIGGLSSAHAALWAGATHVFPPSGSFKATEMLHLVRQHGVTCFIAVPTMLHDLLQAWDAEPHQALVSVTRLLLGGGAVPGALLARAAAHLVPHATVTGTYALSEACSSVAFRTLAAAGAVSDIPREPRDGDEDLPPGADASAASAGVCCGLPAPGCLVRIAPGGEICVAGPQVMAGYWGDESASNSALVPADGGVMWLHTGDVGRLDAAGRLWLLGRAADVIKSGGENVHAAEVEAALATHPAVASAVVVPVPHDRWGAAVAACVVLAPGATWKGPTAPTRAAAAHVSAAGVGLPHSASGGPAPTNEMGVSPVKTTPASLRAHVTSPAVGLARFKAPVLIAAWTGAALPLGPTGKVDKRAVGAAMRALALEQTSTGAVSRQLRSRL